MVLLVLGKCFWNFNISFPSEQRNQFEIQRVPS